MTIKYLDSKRISGLSTDVMDTAKLSSLGSTFEQASNNDSRTFGVSGRTALGVKLSAGHFLVGKTVRTFSVIVNQDPSGAGDIKAYVIRSGYGSNDQVAESTASTLPTGTGNTTFNITFTFSSDVSILANDIIAFTNVGMTSVSSAKTSSSDIDPNAEALCVVSGTAFTFSDFVTMSGTYNNLAYRTTPTNGTSTFFTNAGGGDVKVSSDLLSYDCGSGGTSDSRSYLDLADDGWVSEEASVLNVDSINNYLNFLANSSLTGKDLISKDLTSVDTQFVARFSVDFTTVTNSGGAGTKAFIGLSSDAGYGTSVNYLGFKIRSQAPSADDMGLDAGENGDWVGGGVDELHSTSPSVAKYYVEIKRTTMTNTTLSLYANPDYTGLVGSTLTSTTSVSDLRYFVVGLSQNTSYASKIIGKLADFKFYNGTTSVSGTPTFTDNFDTETVSESAWVLRFKMTSTVVSNSASSCHLGFGLSSITSAWDINGKALVFVRGAGTNANDNQYYLSRATTGGFVDNGNANKAGFATSTGNVTNQVYYVELKRTSATTVVATIFSDAYATSVESETFTNLSGVTGLRYLKCASRSQNTNTNNGTISDVTFYNGVSSLSSKPTNVQDNSILVEKDTGKRYWFDAESDITPTDLNTPTWTKSTSDLSQTTDYIQWANMTGGTENGYYDIGSGSVSDTKWVLRAKLTISSYSSGGASQSRWCSLGLSSTSSTMTGTQDSINIILRTNSSSDTIAGTRSNGTSLNGQLGTAGISGVTLGNGTFYLEMIRESDSDYKLYVRSGSHTGTLLGTGIYTNASGVTGLQYIKTGRNYQSSASGDFVAKWEDIEFYNNTTNRITPATWTNPKIKTALTIDTVNYETTQSTASSRSLSFTVNAETDQHKMLIVGISGGGASLTVTGVTYAGVSMTALATGGSGSPYYSEYRLFYLLDPPTGTANIIATQSTGTNMSIRFGLSVYGVKQSAPVGVASGRYATPNTLTQSITASVSGSWIISSITGSDVNNASPPSNYYTVSELATLNLGTASYQQNGLDQSPTIGSASSPSFNYKHPANNNAQPVGMFSLVLEPYG